MITPSLIPNAPKKKLSDKALKKLQNFYEALETADMPAVEKHLNAHPEQINHMLLTSSRQCNCYPIHIAAGLRPDKYPDSDQFIAVLAQRGADLNKADILGHTPLMYTVGRHHLQSLQFLLKSGVDLDLQDPSGFTALILAVRYNFVEGVRHLIASGADLSKRTRIAQLDRSETALCLAISLNHRECVKLLVEAGATIVPASLKDASEEIAVYLKEVLHVQQERQELEALNLNQDRDTSSETGLKASHRPEVSDSPVLTLKTKRKAI